jgi:excinuclease ABC subunit B
LAYESSDELEQIIEKLQAEMKKAAEELAFEKAAELRDEIKRLRQLDMDLR